MPVVTVRVTFQPPNQPKTGTWVVEIGGLPVNELQNFLRFKGVLAEGDWDEERNVLVFKMKRSRTGPQGSIYNYTKAFANDFLAVLEEELGYSVVSSTDGEPAYGNVHLIPRYLTLQKDDLRRRRSWP